MGRSVGTADDVAMFERAPGSTEAMTAAMRLTSAGPNAGRNVSRIADHMLHDGVHRTTMRRFNGLDATLISVLYNSHRRGALRLCVRRVSRTMARTIFS